jgi:hypothetical protein
MALQYSAATYLARLNQIDTITGVSPLLRIFSGTAPANCAAADTGTLLATIALPATWMNAASGTTKTKLGTWTGTASGGAGATPTHFRIWNSGATVCHLQGTCGIGAGDLSVDGTITSGQTVTVNTFTLTAANI